MATKKVVTAANNPNLQPPTEEHLFVKPAALFAGPGKVMGFTPAVISSKRGVICNALREISGIDPVNPPYWATPGEAMEEYNGSNTKPEPSLSYGGLVRLYSKAA